jgi:hypothetical protein
VFGGDVVGPVVSAGGDPFWSERLECDPLPDDGTGAGRREAEGGCGATGARCAWTVVRAAIRALVDDPGHHARRAQDGAGRATRLASSGALWRFFHRHKITRKKDRAWHEQDRPDIVKRREPGSMASGISIPTAMCSTPQRPTSTNTCRRYGRTVAEMAKGSESAFLMCTPKQRSSSPDCTLTKSSPRWFWTDPQTAPPLSALQRIQI